MPDFPTSTICSLGKEQLADGKKLVIRGGYEDRKIIFLIPNGASEFTEPLAYRYEIAFACQACFISWVIIQSPDTDVLALYATHSSASAVKSFSSRPVSVITSVLAQVLPALHAVSVWHDKYTSRSIEEGIGKTKPQQSPPGQSSFRQTAAPWWFTQGDVWSAQSSTTYIILQWRSKIQCRCDMSCLSKTTPSLPRGIWMGKAQRYLAAFLYMPSSLTWTRHAPLKESESKSNCCSVNLGYCLVLKLVFAWQTLTCAKIHMVSSWTQTMIPRTILISRQIKYVFSYFTAESNRIPVVSRVSENLNRKRRKGGNKVFSCTKEVLCCRCIWS